MESCFGLHRHVTTIVYTKQVRSVSGMDFMLDESKITGESVQCGSIGWRYCLK